MYVEYLSNAQKNCYKDKHISDDFTNLEQILLCKRLERQSIFGTFTKMLVNYRDGSRFKYQDCIVDANNNAEKAVHCIRGYITDMGIDNDKMVE